MSTAKVVVVLDRLVLADGRRDPSRSGSVVVLLRARVEAAHRPLDDLPDDDPERHGVPLAALELVEAGAGGRSAPPRRRPRGRAGAGSRARGRGGSSSRPGACVLRPRAVDCLRRRAHRSSRTESLRARLDLTRRPRKRSPPATDSSLDERSSMPTSSRSRSPFSSASRSSTAASSWRRSSRACSRAPST